MKDAHTRRWLLACLLGALAAVGVFAGTQSGVGTLNDSAYYFSAAESLAAGQGLRVEISPLDLPTWTDTFAAWPPRYPMLLSVGVLLGLSASESARLLGLLSVFDMAVALFWLAHHLSAQWRVAAVAVVLAFTMRPVWQIMHYGLSEPLFMALSYATLAALSKPTIADAAGTKRQKTAWIAFFGLSLMMLTRYLGGAFFVAGLALFLWNPTGRAKLEWRPTVIILLSPLPLLAYLLRNWRLTGTLTDAQREGYPGSLDAFAREFLTGWWPDSPLRLGLSAVVEPTMPWMVVGVATVLLALFALERRRKAQVVPLPGTAHIPSATISAARVIGVAIIAYGGVVAVLSAGGRVWPNDISRLLIPIWPLMAVLAAGTAPVVVQTAALRRTAMIAVVVLLLVQIIGAARFSQAARHGLGFGADPWQTSQALTSATDYVFQRHPPEQVALYSNFAPAVWLRTHTPVKRLDGTWDGRKICASFSGLPADAAEFMVVLFSQVTPVVADPSWRGEFEGQLSSCIVGSPILIPVADGLIVTGTPQRGK